MDDQVVMVLGVRKSPLLNWGISVQAKRFNIHYDTFNSHVNVGHDNFQKLLLILKMRRNVDHINFQPALIF